MNSKTILGISLAAIFAMGGITATTVLQAYADGDLEPSGEERVSVTAKLPGVKMAPGEVLVLLDTTGSGTLDRAHVAINLPCDGENNPNLVVVAGVAGGPVAPVISSSAEFTGFKGPKGTCVFHNTISLVDGPIDGVSSVDLSPATVTEITDLILINLSDGKTNLPRYSVATITGTYAEHDD